MTGDLELRLRDAFAAARLPTAPQSLSHVLAELAIEPESTPKARGRRGVALAAIAMLALGVVSFTGTIMLMSGSAAGPAGPPPTTEPTPTTPTPSASPSPDALDGIHVYEVGELKAAMAGPDRPTGPIALRGFWTDRTVVHSCVPMQHSETNLEGYCHDGEYGITQLNEPIGTLLPGSRYRPASGPALTPWIPEALASRLFQLPIVNEQRYTPVPIVVIGHIDDPRASDCAAEFLQTCLDRFVIDEIVTFDPSSVPAPTPTPIPTPFPFDAPPAPPLAAADCDEVSKASFVGWTTVGEISSYDTPDPDMPVFAVISANVVQTQGWTDDPDGSGRKFREFGRKMCLGYEFEPGVIGYGISRGSAYREWDDGTRTPIEP